MLHKTVGQTLAVAAIVAVFTGCTESGNDNSPTSVSQLPQQDEEVVWQEASGLPEPIASEPEPMPLTVASANVTEKCNKGAQIYVSNRFYLLNNLWRWQDLNQDLSWCCIYYDQSTGNYGTKWCVLSGAVTGIKAYPALVSGCRWGSCSGSSDFPLKVTNDLYVSYIIDHITYTHEYDHLNVKDHHNVVFEFWIDEGPSKNGDYALEMMVHLVDENMRPDERDIELVGTFDGMKWYGKVPSLGGDKTPFINFYPETQIMGVTNLNMKPFIDFAVSNGVCSNNWHYHVIEYGTEMICGEAEVEISHYYYGKSPESNPPQVPDWPSTSVKVR